MAGGAPFSSFNRFTLYTPNSAALIQKFFESKAIFDPLSPTGFSKWNEENPNGWSLSAIVCRRGVPSVAPIRGLSEASLTKLLAENDARRGRDGRRQLDEGDSFARGFLRQQRTAGFHRPRRRLSASILAGERRAGRGLRGFSQTYVSDGKLWQEAKGGEDSVERKPQASASRWSRWSATSILQPS
jgi:hypothetical protein